MAGAIGKSGQQEGQVHSSSKPFQYVWKSILLLVVWLHDRILVVVCLSTTFVRCHRQGLEP